MKIKWQYSSKNVVGYSGNKEHGEARGEHEGRMEIRRECGHRQLNH